MIMKSPPQALSTADTSTVPAEGWLVEKALASSSHTLYSTEQYPIHKLCVIKLVTKQNWLQIKINCTNQTSKQNYLENASNKSNSFDRQDVLLFRCQS